MVQVHKHILFPISLCFGYIPILILLPSVSYYCGKRLDILKETFNHQDGMLFLFFFPWYFVCFVFIAFHILTIFYNNTWTAVLLNGVASLMNLVAGLALGSIVTNYYSLVTVSENLLHFKSELIAILVGVVLLIIIQIIGYSSWPVFAQMKLKSFRPTQPPSQQHDEQSNTIGTLKTICLKISIAFFIMFGGIALLCHTGGAIAHTVTLLNEFKKADDRKALLKDHYVMFWVVSLYIVVGLYVLLVPLLILTIVLPYKKFPWISYLIAPINSLLQVFVGYSVFQGSFFVHILNAYKHMPDSWDDTTRDYLRSTLSILIGDVFLVLSLMAITCLWSLNFWLNAAAPAGSAAEQALHGEEIASLIGNEEQPEQLMMARELNRGTQPPAYTDPSVVLTHDPISQAEEDGDKTQK